MAAACAILAARRSLDPAAEAEAVAAAHELWCEHKLAPPGLPPTPTRPRRMPDGLTLLWPFAEAGVTVDDVASLTVDLAGGVESDDVE